MDLFWSLPKNANSSLSANLGQLFDPAQSRHYDANAVLSDPGCSPERAYLCSSGTLKVSKLLSNGHEILIAILEAGALWSDRALLQGYWRDVFVQALSPVETISVDRELFEHFVQDNPERLTETMRRISEQVSDALTLLEDFRGRDVASRLASVLVRFSKEHGVEKNNGVVIEIPFTHQDLANMIGAARETVSRSMARFRAEGYVRDGKNATLEIVNLSRLEALVV